MKTTQKQRFESLANSPLRQDPYLKEMGIFNCANARELKIELEYHLDILNNILKQVLRGDKFQWHLGKVYHFNQIMLTKRIASLDKIIDVMEFKVTEQNGFYFINR